VPRAAFRDSDWGNRFHDRREKPGRRSNASGKHTCKEELDDIRSGAIDAKTGERAARIALGHIDLEH
jgi:hypothetical protein